MATPLVFSLEDECFDLSILLSSSRREVGCNSYKWVFKTKCDSHGNLERYKSRLVAKGFNRKDDID